MQLNTLQSFQQEWRETIDEIESNLPVKQKLYRSLGVMGGLFSGSAVAVMEEWQVEDGIIFKIGAVGILVSVLGQVLKHSGREEQAFLTSLAGLIIVLFWLFFPYYFKFSRHYPAVVYALRGKLWGSSGSLYLGYRDFYWHLW